MAIKFSVRQCGDDYYFVDMIKKALPDYDIVGLSNGNIQEVPGVDLGNAIAFLFSSEMNGEETGTSILPHIGVEFLDESELSSGGLLGHSDQIFKIEKSLLNEMKAINKGDRFAIGLQISDDQIDEMIDIIGDEAPFVDLYSNKNQMLADISLSVSIWTTSKQHTRLISEIVRSIIQSGVKDLSKRGVKNINVSRSGSLYNYDFDRTIYGSEIKIKYLNTVTDYFVDETIKTINKINITGKFEEKDGTDNYSRTIEVE